MTCARARAMEDGCPKRRLGASDPSRLGLGTAARGMAEASGRTQRSAKAKSRGPARLSDVGCIPPPLRSMYMDNMYICMDMHMYMNMTYMYMCMSMYVHDMDLHQSGRGMHRLHTTT